MKNDNTPYIKAAYPFFSCNPEGDALFSVREGVPAIDALEYASTFLSVASATAHNAALSTNDEQSFAAAYLIDMSKAIVDAAIKAM